MAWSVNFEEDAKKELAKLDKTIAARIVKFLDERIATDEDPRRFGEALTGNLDGLWRYRVGSFRIIVEIQENELIVIVVRVGHRSKVYRE